MKNNWPTKQLGEILSEIRNGTTARQNQEGVGYPVTRIETVQNSSIDRDRIGFVELSAKEFEKYKLKDGDILFSHINSEEHLGKVAIYYGEIKNLILGMNLLRFRVNEKLILPSFLYYFFLTGSAKRQIKKNAKRAVNQASINQAQINKFLIPLPPLKIQKQIVERLDKIAEARKLNDDLIQKSDEFYRSLLHNELNAKVKNQNVKSQFKIKKLGEICEINPRKAEINKLSKDTIVSFLAMADVSESAEITNLQERKLAEVRNGFTFFKNGDVLVAKITPCFENGKGAFVEGMKNEIGFGSTEFHVLRANSEILLNRFLYHLVSDKKFRKIGARFMTGSAGQRRVSKHYLENFKIPLPPLETQKQIVTKLSAVQDYKIQLLEQKAKLKELFDSALHKSMTQRPIRKLSLLTGHGFSTRF